MFHSKMSRKKQLYLDSNIINEYKGGDEYNYSFKIEKHYFNVIQVGDIFEMSIDNRTFSYFLHKEKFKPKKESSQIIK